MTTNYCSNCGEAAPTENTKFCPNCGRPYLAEEKRYENNNSQYSQDYTNYPSRAEYSRQSEAYVVKQKSPFLALILSFFWTGLGQLYNGKFVKGICFQVALPIGLAMLIVPGIIVWVICLWDAYNDSEKMNRGEIPFEEPSVGEIIAFIFFWVFVILAIIMLVAVFSIPLAFI